MPHLWRSVSLGSIFYENGAPTELGNERDAKFTRRVIHGAALVVSAVAVPFTGGTSLALANLALISTDIVISEVDNNINEAWESMTEAERNQHKTGYSAWKTFHSGWNTMNTVVAVGSLATLARSGALALNRYAGLLRVNARFNNFVKSGSSFFAAISKKTFGKSFTAFNQRMGRFVGWGASGAGKVAKYPINNFFEYVNHSFSATQKQLFEKAKKFYSSFNPSFNVNELRGIDFDMPVVNIVKRENNVMYQLSTIDPVTGKPRFGAYFFDDLNEDITKIGVGDLQRIKADGRVKVKIILSEDVEFLKTKTANIEDWNGTGTIFEGGGNQFYNPIAKQKIKSFEVIKTY